MGFPMAPNLHGGMSKGPCLYDISPALKILPNADRQAEQCGTYLPILERRPPVAAFSLAWLIRCSFSVLVGFQRHCQVPDAGEYSYSFLCNVSHCFLFLFFVFFLI